MAYEPLDFGVLHEGYRAAETLHRASAIAAHDEGRNAAAVQVQDHLLLVFERAADHLDQALREWLPVAGGELIAHVDELHLGVMSADSLGELCQGKLAALSIVIGDHA